MIFIALGANLPGPYGQPENTFFAAVKALKAHDVTVIKASRIWITPPVPVSDQPDYRNAVVQIKTALTPERLLFLLHEIEKKFGRIRKKKNEARVLDLDLIAYHDRVVDEPDLQIPHRRMHERSFVLLPMLDIAPDWRHPVLGKTVTDMAAGIPHDPKLRPLEKKAA